MTSRFIVGLVFCISMLFSCKEQETSTPSSTPTQSEIASTTDLHTSTKGSGEPIIVIHGGPGLSAAYLEEHLDGLAGEYQLIFYDQRNSGRSELDNDGSKMTLAGFLKDIDDIRKAYGHEKVHIMAHSWGGLLGMKYALNYSEQVDNLILVNSLSPDVDINQKNDIRLGNLMSADDIKARNQIMRTEAFKNSDPKAFEELMHIGFGYLFADPNQLKNLTLDLPSDYAAKSQQLGLLSADFSEYNYTEELASLQMPILLISGIKDPGVPLALNSLTAAIPEATIVGINDAGHFPFIEQPEEFISKVKTFLAN